MLGQIRQGNTQAETVIRGQHDQLTGAIDREQRTKRELVSLSCDKVWKNVSSRFTYKAAVTGGAVVVLSRARLFAPTCST